MQEPGQSYQNIRGSQEKQPTTVMLIMCQMLPFRNCHQAASGLLACSLTGHPANDPKLRRHETARISRGTGGEPSTELYAAAPECDLDQQP
jgi:hypothetical protein